MSGLLPGFVDPVAGAQLAFRAVLDALSHPGLVVPCGEGLEAPAPLAPAAAAVLLALVDADTPLWLDAGGAAEAWARFHCGAPLLAGPAGAAFAVATGTPPPLDQLDAGTDEAPQRSATLVLQVAALTEGTGWRLSGPGIAASRRLRVEGAPPGFVRHWAANRALFPRGVDVILCAGRHLAALPRTVRIEEA
jgi:alpha-D-ribose 1-methylphosphonate 5-triphosphate synthase subunit PhnH